MILTSSVVKTAHKIHLINKKNSKTLKNYTKAELKYISDGIASEQSIIPLFKGEGTTFLTVLPEEKTPSKQAEKIRLLGFKLCQKVNEQKVEKITIQDEEGKESNVLSLCEGLLLSNYQFNKYKKKPKVNSLKKIGLNKSVVSKKALTELNILTESVYFTRDLVNEPLSYLTAVQYSKDITAIGKKCGFKTTVWNQKKIASLKMGGVMSVNKGSVQPATFNILEYKPVNATNKKPIVLVGKGVMYDTGGLSLKPTANSMDFMKSDMGGSAVVVGTMMAIAKNKLNKHVIGLIPAVENRPGGDAFAPGDVITMYDKTTVEILNTDAEGRLILADALAYAKELKPSLVCDFATLTGSAARAIGPHGIAMMGTCNKSIKSGVQDSGFKTYERVVELPLWDEYGEMLESNIADIQNLGGATAGAITAGKFLEHFTDYPWLHFDIAPVAYFHNTTNYRGKNGTGTGVRLMYDFIKSMK